MPLQLRFMSLVEDQPGPAWQAHAAALWPGYQGWWQRDGEIKRPSYLACRKAMREHMPELVPVWQRLSELLGGSDAQARFLSMWGPPPYITGCSQAVWLGATPEEARLVRNYDFAPALFEGAWLVTKWTGQRVISMSDCLWGALDGINESGLAMSLSFGGRTQVGHGFGIPLVVRYVLEVATNVAEAVKLLKRLPHHMSYSLTLLDRSGAWSTVFVAPDRPTEVVDRRGVTNVQHRVEWLQHEQATRASLRADKLDAALKEVKSFEELCGRMMQAPLWQGAFARGYGTLYTAAYAPSLGEACLIWPNEPAWRQTMQAHVSGVREIDMSESPSIETQVLKSQDRWVFSSPTSF